MFLIVSVEKLEQVKAKVQHLDEQLESICDGWKNPNYQMLFTARAQVWTEQDNDAHSQTHNILQATRYAPATQSYLLH